MAIRDSVDRLQAWCAGQEGGVRLALGPPLDDRRIDALPYVLEKDYPWWLTVPFRPADFPIPAGYREFLRICSFARIEYQEEGRDWSVYEPVNIFSPQEVARGQSFTVGGTTLGDDREIHTTFLVAFATAGYNVEASRWCFCTDGDLPRQSGELPILRESNDYECDLAKYVDTGEWTENAFTTPAALSFAAWLDALVSEVTRRPFDPDRRDAIPNSGFVRLSECSRV
ncbi:hypothetical protein GCM10010207_85790 [Streptomyces atratus]|nr:hypothetical protein GCM10010207_85790 [Streptomyces atratus]